MNITMTIRRLALLPVTFYRNFISPALPPSCRYAPSCSTYAVESVMTHGIIKGTILATWRILRCNPWSHGGVDHVPPKGRWTSDPWVPPTDWVGHGEGEWIPMGLPESLTDEDQARMIQQAKDSLDMRINDAAHPTDHPANAGRPAKTSSLPPT